MKKRIPRVRILLTLLSIWPVFTIGCAKTLCIKTFDATTGRPLPGVLARWSEDNQDLVLGSYHYGPTNLPPSTESGAINIHNVKQRCVSRFIFSHPGYLNLYGIYSDGTLSLGGTIKSTSDDRFILDGNLVAAPASNGWLIVAMKSVIH